MKGERLADTKFGDLPEGCWDKPGSYWKYLNADGSEMRSKCAENLTGTVWGIHPPVGGIVTLTKHTVREHEDGTISVRPGDGSSNSILVMGGPGPGQWHGYIEHGEWRPA